LFFQDSQQITLVTTCNALMNDELVTVYADSCSKVTGSWLFESWGICWNFLLRYELYIFALFNVITH